jgi:hypothetical protein
MLLATGICTRFNQFNGYFYKIIKSDHLMTQQTWKFMRIQYNMLIDLIRFIDSWITFFVFLCITHNVFVLGVKVFDGIKSTRLNTMDQVYFWFFVSTMISRIGGVLFICAQLNNASMKPLELIAKVPSKKWTLDVRFK